MEKSVLFTGGEDGSFGSAAVGGFAQDDISRQISEFPSVSVLYHHTAKRRSLQAKAACSQIGAELFTICSPQWYNLRYNVDKLKEISFQEDYEYGCFCFDRGR